MDAVNRPDRRFGPRHGVIRNAPGVHSWLFLRTVADTRSVFRCRKCGVQVETPATFPKWSQSEYWDGKPMKKRQARPACGGVTCT